MTFQICAVGQGGIAKNSTVSCSVASLMHEIIDRHSHFMSLPKNGSMQWVVKSDSQHCAPFPCSVLSGGHLEKRHAIWIIMVSTSSQEAVFHQAVKKFQEVVEQRIRHPNHIEWQEWESRQKQETDVSRAEERLKNQQSTLQSNLKQAEEEAKNAKENAEHSARHAAGEARIAKVAADKVGALRAETAKKNKEAADITAKEIADAETLYKEKSKELEKRRAIYQEQQKAAQEKAVASLIQKLLEEMENADVPLALLRERLSTHPTVATAKK